MPRPQQLATSHFDAPLEFLDLFLPVNLSSQSRARAFLWIMFHYLQGPDKPNPFDDDYARANPCKVPRMRNLSRDEMQQENVDPPDEVEWGRRMSAHRSKFLRELVEEMEQEKRKPKPFPPPPLIIQSPSLVPRESPLSLQARRRTAPRAAQAHRAFAAVSRSYRPAGSTSGGSRGSSLSHDYPVHPHANHEPAHRAARPPPYQGERHCDTRALGRELSVRCRCSR